MIVSFICLAYAWFIVEAIGAMQSAIEMPDGHD